jgi:hypothetical protein
MQAPVHISWVAAARTSGSPWPPNDSGALMPFQPASRQFR